MGRNMIMTKEYDNKSYCAQTGVKYKYNNNLYTPEQNGPAEHFHQAILNNVRFILHHSKMPLSFWPDRAIYFAYTCSIVLVIKVTV